MTTFSIQAPTPFVCLCQDFKTHQFSAMESVVRSGNIKELEVRPLLNELKDVQIKASENEQLKKCIDWLQKIVDTLPPEHIPEPRNRGVRDLMMAAILASSLNLK